jgi:lipocalin/uncharacterized protein YbbK (DUF523 family)/ligand-binding SRPBCC domain-containing protein
MTHERIRLGISACLLGKLVRFDGGHKRDPFLVESLGQFVDWVPVCPEVESGLDAPRESMRLVQADGQIRLLTNKTAQDHTPRMNRFARRRVEELADAELCGFVLKKDSPTCGLERVKVYGSAGMPVKSGRGLFADALVRRFPLLPVEEEGRLNDPRLRENFVERIFAYRRLTALFAARWSMGDVVRFHTAHKLTLMAHRPEAYQRLGRLVASGKSMARRAFQDLSSFRYSSIIGAPAADVFRWHEQPGALAALTPATLVRIEQREGGIRDGGRVTVSIGIGRARVRWSMRHYGYIDGRRFCDEQVAGPFAVWRHAHVFESLSPRQTLYEDRIEFAVWRRRALNRLAAAVLRPLLRIAFAHRHRVVRTAIGNARPRVAPRWAAAVALVAATTLQMAAAPAQTPPPVRAVPFVDLDRYAGDWFEIARFPNRFQLQCVGDVRATYARRPDGRVDVVNRCRTGEGETEARGAARIVDERTFAKLKVRFAPAWLSWLPMVWGDYWIVGLAPDYSWAVVGDPGRDYLWILARAPHLDDASLAVARAAARDNGFDLTRLVPTSQASAARP